MNRNETKQILLCMDTLYPNWHPKDATLMADAWSVILADYAYDDIYKALLAYVKTDTNGFAPVIGQLVAIADNAQEISTEEAVDLVRKATRNSLYGAEEEFKKLPKLVQQAIGGPSALRAWGACSKESLEAVELSHFRKAYRAVCERTKIDAVKNNVAMLTNKHMAALTD